MSKFKKSMAMVLVVMFCFSCITCHAAYTSTYAIVRSNGGFYGLEGDFKIPTLNSAWNSTTNQLNKINFELWTCVNGSTGDWLELGYKEGNVADGTSNGAYYNGFFKSKSVNGVYGYGSLNKSFSVGTTYTFEIVDVNKAGLWEIYIGSTYFGSFADTVGPSTTSMPNDFGYEVTRNTGTQTTTSTTITNMKYYDGSWKSISSRSPVVYDDASIVSLTYNSSTNTATFTGNK